MLRDEYLMFEPLDRFLRLSGLTGECTSLKKSWGEMQRLLCFRDGAWVLHQTLGAGRIVRMTRDSATIDFDGSPAYGIRLEALLDSARPLSEDSKAVIRRLHPEEFRRLLEDPPALLGSLLEEMGGRLTRAEASAIAGQHDAAEVWKKLLEAAEKDPRTVPSGDAIELRGSAPPDQVIQGILSSKDPLVQRNREVARVLKQLGPALRAETSASVLLHLPKLRTPETGGLFELRWLLMGEPAPDPVPEALAGLVEKSAGRAVRAIGEITAVQCRKAYIEAFLHMAPDGEIREFLDALPRNLWIPAAEAARRARPEQLKSYLDALLADKTDPDLHLRAVEIILTWGLPGPEGFNATNSVLETIPWAKAEQARRSIQALLGNRLVELQSHLRSLDSRRLSILADSLAEVGAAQDTGLVLEILREHSSRRSGTSERAHFWEGEYIFDNSAAIERRHQALRKMRAEDLPSAARAISEAASHGDLSENAEYKAALERRDLLIDGIRRGLKQMERLRPYPSRDLLLSVCSPGTRVRLEPFDGSPALELSLVGPLEASPEEGRVNYLAPLGAALLGCAPGDEIEIPGDERKFKVASIEILPEAGEVLE
jgi:transcription elongation GreA/GreB family factor